MHKTHEGKLSAKGYNFGIVISRFNDMVTKELKEGAIDCLRRHNAKEENIHLYWVPGSYEIPGTVKKIVGSNQFDGIICLGAIIRGDTPHFDMVANETSKGIAKTNLEADIPISFGVLTTDTIEQALERAGTKAGNRGWDAAQSNIEMVNLYNNIENG